MKGSDMEILEEILNMAVLELKDTCLTSIYGYFDVSWRII
jgi:hypothetical protein